MLQSFARGAVAVASQHGEAVALVDALHERAGVVGVGVGAEFAGLGVFARGDLGAVGSHLEAGVGRGEAEVSWIFAAAVSGDATSAMFGAAGRDEDDGCALLRALRALVVTIALGSGGGLALAMVGRFGCGLRRLTARTGTGHAYRSFEVG